MEKIYSRFKRNDIRSLKLDCYNLMRKTYIEIGQKPSDEQVKLNANLLYNDLVAYYGGMTMHEVEFVFHNGIRNAEEGTSVFINVRQWSVWLKDHKKTEALCRQNKQITKYERYRKNQKLIGTTINKAKQIK